MRVRAASGYDLNDVPGVGFWYACEVSVRLQGG